ncbi:hypothetical protein [Bacillus sp. FJAT-22090]|uniref:hypothetical protein n=1 Tax=Bacillus sp. FJAT-22090 TaxID=1581038 RepID=UPI0011A0B869|nr:hypothetical protein [Bacillus sp. FJAT-22090]
MDYSSAIIGRVCSSKLELYLTIYEWKLNWGFEAPRPSKIETIFNTRNGFPNEGQTFQILKYRSIESKLKENNGWISIEDESFDNVSSHLEKFQKDAASMNKGTQNLTVVFQENPVTYDNKDKYFYKVKEDNSYILAISNAKEQKLFVMQWIQ